MNRAVTGASVHDLSHQVTGREPGRTTYPLYDEAVLGLPGFWNPVCFADEVRNDRPIGVQVRGHKLALMRDEEGTVRALVDRCPHRGVPLSIGTCEFPGNLTCRYHGWTWDLKNGALKAALTDGADSPICKQGSAQARTYRVQERANMVWAYVDDDEAPSLGDQLPEEFAARDLLVLGRWQDVEADWRHGVENGFDEGHAKMLHRTSLWKTFRYVPAWSKIKVTTSEDSRTLTRTVTDKGFETDYPGLGVWPHKRHWWQKPEGKPGGKRKPPVVSVNLPGIVRVHWPDHPLGEFDFWEIWVAAEPHRYRIFQLLTQRARGLIRWRTRIAYDLAIRWIYHHSFHDEDLLMVRAMETPPEVLYRPDRSISAWRRMVEDYLTKRGLGDHRPPYNSDEPQSLRKT